jgi:hypothetical protein
MSEPDLSHEIGDAIASCEWFWRVNALHAWDEHTKEMAALGVVEKPTDCRASVGAKVVTVWLPQGAVIRIRRDRFSRRGLASAYEQTFHHRYGRDRNNRIVIKLRPGRFAPTTTTTPEKP